MGKLYSKHGSNTNDTNIAYKEYQYNRVYISYIKEKLKKASHALSGNLL
jgi:hypothetical protein